jgi:ABC-type multidrug transport system fused ATPase/permease subunit
MISLPIRPHSDRILPDIRGYSTTSWRNTIGFVPQDPVLFTGTIASNIAYGNLSATREEIEAAAREANCEFVWGMPDGFDTESTPMRTHSLTVPDTDSNPFPPRPSWAS